MTGKKRIGYTLEPIIQDKTRQTSHNQSKEDGTQTKKNI